MAPAASGSRTWPPPAPAKEASSPQGQQSTAVSLTAAGEGGSPRPSRERLPWPKQPRPERGNARAVVSRFPNAISLSVRRTGQLCLASPIAFRLGSPPSGRDPRVPRSRSKPLRKPAPEAEAEGLTINISSGSGDLLADRSGSASPPSRGVPSPHRTAAAKHSAPFSEGGLFSLEEPAGCPRPCLAPPRGRSARAARRGPQHRGLPYLRLGRLRSLHAAPPPLAFPFPFPPPSPPSSQTSLAGAEPSPAPPARLSVLGAASAPLRTKPP